MGPVLSPMGPVLSPMGSSVSTRKLIVAALLCGLAILVAFALQITLVAK